MALDQSEIIRMAREAGLYESDDIISWPSSTALERFAALVAEATKAQPQGEPVAWVIWGEGNVPELTWDTPKPDDVANALYYTPTSVEAMRIETLEKAAKVCDEEMQGWIEFDGNCREASASKRCAAAIRSMK